MKLRGGGGVLYEAAWLSGPGSAGRTQRALSCQRIRRRRIRQPVTGVSGPGDRMCSLAPDVVLYEASQASRRLAVRPTKGSLRAAVRTTSYVGKKELSCLRRAREEALLTIYVEVEVEVLRITGLFLAPPGPVGGFSGLPALPTLLLHVP